MKKILTCLLLTFCCDNSTEDRPAPELQLVGRWETVYYKIRADTPSDVEMVQANTGEVVHVHPYEYPNCPHVYEFFIDGTSTFGSRIIDDEANTCTSAINLWEDTFYAGFVGYLPYTNSLGESGEIRTNLPVIRQWDPSYTWSVDLFHPNKFQWYSGDSLMSAADYSIVGDTLIFTIGPDVVYPWGIDRIYGRSESYYIRID